MNIDWARSREHFSTIRYSKNILVLIVEIY